ncbi:microtubule-associated protein futsch isoform X2 [Drosophila virilis]|uniref:microtubule-associated protein futsch isoform X2 n=1 Tax=Drosophila virilis TaxID=7244 RepID=UPI001395EF3B|nr:microtubule-associated protein futsch isoform X2 [Drosophila virilis]
MSETKTLLSALLCDIYGQQEQQARRLRRCRRQKGQDRRISKEQRHCRRSTKKGPVARMASSLAGNQNVLETLNVRQLVDVCAMLKVELLMMGYLLERVLVVRDRLQRHQEVLCEFVTAILVVETHDAQPKMRFSLSPPPPKVSLTSPTSSTSNNNNNSGYCKAPSRSRNNNNMLSSTPASNADAGADDAASDYNQWLHAMKLVARLPGGTPPEFRRKLWLSLADKYLKSKNVDWAQQREKCFCEEWREDDEELGIQIVKDLHRTGSNLCTGPAGSINQAKLKRILLGYARYNPEVGYCQGFNMLGALILQVMDKEEEESMKVMIYLVEGVLPTGYFYGSMGGLQADMGVFRELMQTKLPRLAKHLQRLQGPVENAYEPPLTNVFTMQWFLTMFCTCLPMSCVLRVWDLVLIEGSDVLLRTALVLWSLLEERVLNARTADDFYGKMGSFSNELLNGHLIDSNGLIEKVVQLGPIADIKHLRDKHLYNIAPMGNKQGLQLYYDDEDTHSDDESRLAVATVWGLNWGRRGSMGTGSSGAGKPQTEQKDRLALDISLLKKQYDRLRERQKQAHVILTTACTTATSTRQTPSNQLPVNQLLLGRPAIITNKGKRVGAPLGAIPPARKPSLPTVLHSKPPASGERQLRRGETLLWRDTDATRQRRDSLTWKEIKADRAAMLRDEADAKMVKSQKLRSRLGKSDSSSYSEDSDGEQEADEKDGSSTDTSLCDDDDPKSFEQSPKRKAKLARKLKEKPKLATLRDPSVERKRPKSWAPSTHEIPFMLMGTDSGDEKEPVPKEEEDSATECDRFGYARDLDWAQAPGDLASSKEAPLPLGANTLPDTSNLQLTSLPDIATCLSTVSIGPLSTPKSIYVMSDTESVNPADAGSSARRMEGKDESPTSRYDVSNDGVTNQYFERVNSVERPKRLELAYSLCVEDSEVATDREDQRSLVEGQSTEHIAKALPFDLEDKPQIRDDNIPGENKDDYKELLSMTIETQKGPLPATISSACSKRRDPRRKTLTRSSTIELEERFQALERRLSQEKPKRQSDNVECTKCIPTTAALEERYNTLEKQISAEKQRLEDSEFNAECFQKPERIPSTADLELRFNALTKQISSTESNAKTPVELTDQEQTAGSSSKEGNGSEKTSKLHNSEESLTDTKQPANLSDTVHTKESKSPQDLEKPRLKKLPSTAELEDRYNELERRISVQKNSPAKAKKEPPDEGLEHNKNQSRNVSEAPAGAVDNVENEHRDPPNANDPKSSQDKRHETEDKESAHVAEKTVTPNNEKPAHQNGKAKLEKSKETSSTEDKKEVEVVKRKTPPSTEELEKRFNALEKQRSSSKLESKDEAECVSTFNANEAKPEKRKQLSEGENVAKDKNEENTQKSIKSFDDKVRSISTSMTVEEEAAEVTKAKDEKRKAFATKCETADKLLSNETNAVKLTAKSEFKSDPETKPPENANFKELSKRRASEPPSMEDLDQRYERLKRRMSSKNNITGQNETVNEALERIEQEVIAELDDSEVDPKPARKQPPTTENLESRYEALHAKDKKETSTKSEPKIKSPPRQVDVAIEAHIPEAPPLPPPPDHRITIDPGKHQQRALIEELQSKMQGLSPGEENLKPSEINPQRKRLQQQRQLQQRPTPMGDETSEAPANTAYYRSGNYEPWQAQRMVRRFSDLPSRADLENRLQFLEKKLYKKFYKQRCASDSEVASRMSSYDDKPSTSRQAEAQLEERVLALEKQLSENSLKLLEAIREKEKQQEKVPQNTDDDDNSLRQLNTDIETGKELVRYTQNFSELEESDKPINISINIKMLLNKDSENRKPQAELTTDDLRRRLEQLEQQLSEERARNGTIIPDPEFTIEDVLVQPSEQSEESDTCRKQEKDSHNQSVKCDEAEKLEQAPLATARTSEPETVKESKTLQNEETAQTRSKETDTENKIKEEQKVSANVGNEENKVEEKTYPSTDQEKTSTTPAQDVPLKVDVEKSDGVEESVKLDEESTNESSANLVINSSDIGSVDANNKTVVLLMDNEPKALKVRRLTRANTEELEGLFQALEKQLNDRNLVKSKDGKLVHAENKPSAEQIEQAQAISDLSKEIEDFTSRKPDEEPAEQKEEKAVENEPNYDWGPNPVKHHLKRKTVYLPSTKELEARFRSLERQIKLLEDVEKIDVEQRLTEIERKIKLQYSLSHEKDLNKYIELCEGKGLDDDVPVAGETSPVVERSRSPARKQNTKSPFTSPARKSAAKSPHVSPARKDKSATKSPYTSPTRQGQNTPHTSPSRTVNKKSPYTSPARRQRHIDDLPISDDLEYKYRVLDLVRSKSKDNLAKRKNDPSKKPPIHPLEMLLDPSPDDSEIPTTGELEHRIRLLDEKLKSPARHKSRSRSPTIDDIKRKKMLIDQLPKTPVHSLERLVYSPSKPEPPTAEELDKRILALEQEQRFDFKTQKDYKEFNQKLKDVVSPSVSYEEFKAAKSREQSPRRQAPTTPKSAMRRDENEEYYRREETTSYRPTSPKVIRFRDEDEDYYEDSWRPKSRERMTLADQPSASASASRSYISGAAAAAASSEGLDALGSRLMRETSPITRTGTHTGVPLRTGDNINERLSSIKNSIKSIDSLCEEKSYQKEKCQRYIDSLFSDSMHFASKKSSAEDLTHSRSESRGRGTQRYSDYTPAIRISSEHRSLGSVESMRTGSPLLATSPPHHRSHRDISRELSPRRRREAEELEERESSRVRRDNMLPNYLDDNRSELSSCNSLTKFHKVDRQLEETCAKYADDKRSACKSPLSSPYESRTTATRYNTTTANPTVDSFPRPISPYRQPYDPNRPTRSNTPVYQPAKLEIRHTTVTSTFYDRFLTERQIEKQSLPRTGSRSPIVSPSATTKSYSDIPNTLTVHKYSHDPMLDVTTSSSYSPHMSRSYAGSSSNYSYLTTHTATEAPASSSAIAPQLGASPGDTASDLRMRSSCDNILTTSTSTSIPYSSALGQASTPSTHASTRIATTTASAFAPYNFTSSFTSRLSDPVTTTGVSSLSSSLQTYSTGVYNPMMTFTLREPLINPLPGGLGSNGSASLGQHQYKSGYSPNYNSSEPDKP